MRDDACHIFHGKTVHCQEIPDCTRQHLGCRFVNGPCVHGEGRVFRKDGEMIGATAVGIESTAEEAVTSMISLDHDRARTVAKEYTVAVCPVRDLGKSIRPD